jgi:hypothetical protein
VSLRRAARVCSHRRGQKLVACALAQKACWRLSRIDVLVIDAWAMASLSEPERRDFREICEDRYQGAFDDPNLSTAGLSVGTNR